jgi:vacuolar iron transporter family protein
MLEKMRKSLYKLNKKTERHGKGGAFFKDFILGGQDGLVNVLGIILGLSIGTGDVKIVILAGLAAAFAEAVSMGAVAYTSTKVEVDYYYSQEKKEKYEIEKYPQTEKKEIYNIYYKKGFRGKLLNQIVQYIISDKKRWIDIMMKEELDLSKDFVNPIKSAIVVFLAALVGSLIPLLSFFFLPITSAVIFSLIISSIALFIAGAIEAKITIGNWIKKGIQLMIIGMASAGIGFLIGKLFGA